MTEQKPRIDVKPDNVIMDANHVWGIVKADKVAMTGYKPYNWQQFKQIYQTQLLDGKPQFNIGYLKQAKKVLDALNVDIADCAFHFAPDVPLVIDTQEGWYILIAPREIAK